MTKKKELENSINYLTCVINKLKTKINESEEYNEAYNKLLIKRAALRKELCQSKADKILEVVKTSFARFGSGKKEKMIYDYFPAGKF